MPRRSLAPFGALFAFVVLVAGAFVLFQIGGVGLSQAGTDEVTQTNESVVIDYSGSTRVSAATDRYTVGFYDNETVYNQSGSQLVEGTDYTWNTSTGRIAFQNTSNTSDGNTANITYAYDQNVEEIRQSEPVIHRIIDAVGGPIVFAPLVTFAGLVLLGLTYYVTKALRSGPGYGRGR